MSQPTDKTALIRAYLANVADVATDPELGLAAPPWFLDTGDMSDFASSEVRAETWGFNVTRDDDGTVRSYWAESTIPTEVKIFEQETGYQQEQEEDEQVLASVAAHRLAVTAANSSWPMVTALRDILLIAEEAGREGKARRADARNAGQLQLSEIEQTRLEASAAELIRFHDGVMAALEAFATAYPMPYIGDAAAVPVPGEAISEGRRPLTWESAPPPVAP